MFRINRARTCRWLAMLAASMGAASYVAAETGPPVPVIAQSQRDFLARIARRTLRDAVLGREEYTPTYVPTALAELRAEIVVRARQSGYLLASAAAGPKPIALATRDAARNVAAALHAQGQTGLDQVNDMLIELEVIGQAEPIAAGRDWTQPRAVDPFVQPGVHGLVLAGPRINMRFCPTELLTGDLVLADALERLAKVTHDSQAQISEVSLQRFRTLHWHLDGASDETVLLERGLRVLPERAVSAASLEESIETLGEYMIYRQLPSGLFSYQYEPGRDAFSSENNLVRQVGAAAAMAIHADWSGRSASIAAADLAFRYHLQGLTDVPDDPSAAFMATADGRNKLGVTALLLLGMAEHPDAHRYEDHRTRLTNGILWLQLSSGMFLTAFPPAVEIKGQEYFPGEALLALAVQYTHDPNPETLDAFDRAAGYYRDYFHVTHSPAIVPWQVQAFALMATYTKRRDYEQYVYELVDWLAARQLDSSNCDWPEMWGGIAGYGEDRAGVSTAAYLEGFADALKLARLTSARPRVEKYEKVVRSAARFVMQLQVRPEEAYYIRSPKNAVGGIRTSPYLNLLRIDHCQHALVALIKARQALYPERG